MTFISYAQNSEDVILWRALRNVQNGFYIDVGAWDHREHSVTCAFYERGWRGINIEPDNEKFACLQKARPDDINLQMALAENVGERTFFSFPGTGLSTLDPTVARQHRDAGLEFIELIVRVGCLADICNLHASANIHFLKIDVEGAEAAVLAGADLNKHRPWIIVIEVNKPNSLDKNYSAWEHIILNARYHLVYSDGLNNFYVSEEKLSDLSPKFAEPISIFDDFVSVTMLRKALAVHKSGQQIAELSDEFYRVRAQVSAEYNMALAAAEESSSVASICVSPTEENCQRKIRTFYDVGLILHFGFEPPVGIVRVEQYVVELLARQKELDLNFVIFDVNIKAYRRLFVEEEAKLKDIIFNRYNSSFAAPAYAPVPSPEAPEAIHIRDVPLPVHSPQPQQRRPVLHRVATASRISGRLFNEILSKDLLRILPIRSKQSIFRRISTRILRYSLIKIGRISHRMLFSARFLLDSITRCIAYIGREDREVAPPAMAIPMEAGVSESVLEAEPKTTKACQFTRGDALITIANSWDYLDYSYLNRIVKNDGVNLVSVIYDVIAMYLPFSTPAPIHIYHRHWVELGHLANSLIAISKHSRDTYRELIAAPNDLDPPLRYAYLPNFLYVRREQIGEKIVSTLMGCRFVVFCSTIETRKNHQLLLHLWERLRQDVDPNILPILVFVGRWGWGTEAVRALVERNWRLRNHLRILNGTTDAELIWLYRHARFTVFPSLAEGFGLAAAESLSFGTPVVVSNCPALAEATEGLMPAYDPLDLPAWLKEMRRLIQDDEYLGLLRERACRYRGGNYNDFALALRDAVLATEKYEPAFADATREDPACG